MLKAKTILNSSHKSLQADWEDGHSLTNSTAVRDKTERPTERGLQHSSGTELQPSSLQHSFSCNMQSSKNTRIRHRTKCQNRSGLLLEEKKAKRKSKYSRCEATHMGSDVINVIFNILHMSNFEKEKKKLQFLFHFIISTVLLS